jgi:hypothetical protein
MKNAELLSAIKAAGEAAIRLHEENERLRGLVQDMRQFVPDWPTRLHERIREAIDGATTDQPSAAICKHCEDEGSTLLTDALRYRWMRGNATFRDRNGPGLYWYLPRFLQGGSAEQLDAAIDAARAADKPGAVT